MPEKTERPTVEARPGGPYVVKGLEHLKNAKGEDIPTKPSIALCRCGRSSTKPFCDGTHKTFDFSTGKVTDGTANKRDEYRGKQVTVHDNRGICAHAGFCTDNLSAVFKLGTEPWIDPDGAVVEDVIAQVKRCPSGALSYSIEEAEKRDKDRGPVVFVAKNGPYAMQGGIELLGETFGDGASREHFTLCRCGGSKNKPFCDGTHWKVEFDKDE
ncbi:MAG: CDGSH iron-sulfur domain-containing protein [Candidatus Krumholzibacteriia bacterium]